MSASPPRREPGRTAPRPPPPPQPPASGASAEEIALHYSVERFYAYECNLLDERYFEEWLELLAPDVRYWMPLARNFRFGEWALEHTREGQDLNWFDEGRFELEQRVKQLQTGKHWSEEPLSRTSHVIANIEVRPLERGELEVRSRFVVYRNRTETEWDLFMGKRHDWLRRVEDRFRIARRAIYLDQNVLLAKNLTIFF